MSWWSETRPKARKPHTCDLCHRTIEAGETYSRGFGDCGTGDVGRWLECAHCSAWVSLVDLHGYTYGDGFDHDSADELAGDPHDDREAAWGVQFRARWRDDTGQLVSVPSISPDPLMTAPVEATS